MLKYPVAAALLFVAAPVAAAQEESPSAEPRPAPSGARAAIQQAATAFGQCIAAGAQAVDPTFAPEAGAASVAGGCAGQRDRLEQAVAGMIATMPEELQAAAREQLRSQLAQVETHIAAAIRRQREAPPAAPAE